MTITLELSPEQESRVETLARHMGKSSENYLAELLEEVLEDTSDLVIVESRKGEPYIPFGDVLAKFEARHGVFSQY